MRQFSNTVVQKKVMYIHLTYLPYMSSAQELKTKPSQHAVRSLLHVGIRPDILLCRCERPILKSHRNKLALFCNISSKNVVEALDVESIYEVPISYKNNKFDVRVLDHFKIKYKSKANMLPWEKFVERVKNPLHEVTVALVGKYNQVRDAYKSILESFIHAGVANQVKINIKWINAENLENESDGKQIIPFTIKEVSNILKDVDAILVPGGYGVRGSIGKMSAISYARHYNIPFLGICFGMHLAVIEFARNVVGLKDVSSSEFGKCKNPIVGILKEWYLEGKMHNLEESSDLGGTMRLGSYPCVLEQNTLANYIYGCKKISERHRHRYEVSVAYRDVLLKHGMVFSGLSPDNNLPEIVELKEHPWYLAMQFHPEFKSRPFKPHPIFKSFVKFALKEKYKKK